MYQRDDLDFINASKVVNLPNPINGTDLSNKYYIDTIAPVASHFASYTMPLGTIGTVSNIPANMTGFSLNTTTQPETLIYDIYLSLYIRRTGGQLGVFYLLINNILVDKRIAATNTASSVLYDQHSFKFTKVIPPNINVKMQFSKSSAAAGAITVAGTAGVAVGLSSFALFGFKQVNYIS